MGPDNSASPNVGRRPPSRRNKGTTDSSPRPKHESHMGSLAVPPGGLSGRDIQRSSSPESDDRQSVEDLSGDIDLSGGPDNSLPESGGELELPTETEVVKGPLTCQFCGSIVEYRIVRSHGSEQRELLHVFEEGGLVRPGGMCMKSPLRRYLDARKEAGIGPQGGLVHMTTPEDTPLTRADGKVSVLFCGADGGRRSFTITDVTCRNCLKFYQKEHDRIMNTITTDDKAVKISKSAPKKTNKIEAEGGAPLPKATKVKAEQKPRKVAEVPTPHPCGCGCQTQVTTKASFITGHDSKFHGSLKRVGDGRLQIKDLPKQVSKAMFNKCLENEKGVNPVVSEAQYLSSLNPHYTAK